ncbi:MAG: cadmium-translocating P-type ATPase [gamma proteobacterium symbiont of Phacoides pectinatus]
MEAAREETPPAADGCCYHCSLPVDPAEEIHAEIEGESRRFCCIGCRSVCEAIHAAGLQGFYQRTPEGAPLAPPPELPRELALYDLDEVQEEFVTTLGEVRDIHLLVEGIHCAACVWLIENSLRSMPGVELARVNLSGRRLHVQWDNGRLLLSAIIQRLGRIGYAAVPYDPEAAEGGIKRENRHLLYRMAFAGFSMMNLLWISIALYSGADQGEFKGLFHWVGFCLATPTLIYSGQPFFKGAWSGIRNLHLGMDVPIAVGASITYLYSVYVTVSATAVGEVYYDTVVNFLFVILVGRYLEAISKRQAVASTQRLLDLQPRVATVLRDGEERIVPIRSVKSGEVVLVRPGERLPVDGVVIEGSSVIDEAMLTGEAEPIAKGLGTRVSAGTINGHGVLKVEVLGLLRDTALGRIIRQVEEAQVSKAPIQCVADRIVPWFVAVTLTLATLTFLYWVNSDFELALMAATAVLIITCPCAFGLATPMSIAVASGLGARHGILVKNGEVLETLSSINHVVFDKTGTLTEGRMSLTSVRTASGQWRRGEGRAGAEITDLIGRLAAVERYSEHPVASAILDLADEWKLERVSVEEFENHPGYGVRARLGGIEIAAGNRAWMRELGVALNPEFEGVQEALDRQGIGSLHLAWDGAEVALLGLEDRIREDALPLIEALKADGMQLTLLSGDRQGTAEAIARRLGGMEVIAEVMPEDKDRVIARLQAGSHKVAMVGDGVNDAPALVRADIGIALGSGTDVSIASADIVLMSSELRKVRLAVALSRRTLRTIRQNIGISITYNVIMVPLAMATFVTPLVAAVSMPVSSLLVIGNAARIRTLFKKQS